ncbi:MAG: helix-turn-helix domain-containing protein [Bryobacteraceae bacterium]
MPVRSRREQSYLTSAKVALMLGISKRTLHNWVKSGKITPPEVDASNGYYLWKMADVDAVRNILQEESK